jgi:hypothetical protein
MLVMRLVGLRRDACGREPEISSGSPLPAPPQVYIHFPISPRRYGRWVLELFVPETWRSKPPNPGRGLVLRGVGPGMWGCVVEPVLFAAENQLRIVGTLVNLGFR